MTGRQKADAEELRETIFAAVGWLSVVSGKPLRSGTPQLAHRVCRSKANLLKYGPEVINNWMNMVPVRDLEENARCNMNGRYLEVAALTSRIIKVNTGRATAPPMAEYYAELAREFQEGL